VRGVVEQRDHLIRLVQVRLVASRTRSTCSATRRSVTAKASRCARKSLSEFSSISSRAQTRAVGRGQGALALARTLGRPGDLTLSALARNEPYCRGRRRAARPRPRAPPAGRPRRQRSGGRPPRAPASIVHSIQARASSSAGPAARSCQETPAKRVDSRGGENWRESLLVVGGKDVDAEASGLRGSSARWPSSSPGRTGYSGRIEATRR